MANAFRFSLGLSLHKTAEAAAGSLCPGQRDTHSSTASPLSLHGHDLENMESFAPAFLAKQVSGVKIFARFLFLIASLGCNFKPLKHPPPQKANPWLSGYFLPLSRHFPPQVFD